MKDKKRSSGILLPVRSLPSPYGIGDIGPAAYRFADFLSSSKQSFWQILPLNHPHHGGCYSPYSSISAFAGNTLLISPELMVKDGFIKQADLQKKPRFLKGTIDFKVVVKYKEQLLNIAYNTFKKREKKREGYKSFCLHHAFWLDDFALFMALKEKFNDKCWNLWPVEIRDRKKSVLKQLKLELKEEIEKEKLLQFVFLKQWAQLKNYCNKKGIGIIGDIPIYVDYDSSDVWSNSKIFKLDKNTKKMTALSGVPPDYFSATGQLWGNPVYKWNILKKTNYSWWFKRMHHNFDLFDRVRIDHFRGFVAYWEVPAGKRTALNGKWIKVPAKDFFSKLLKRFPKNSIIAEDLGFITQDVRDVMDYFGLPGMKVLQFAFGDDLATNPYVPHNHVENSVVYTGTHDNNTVKGWFKNDAGKETKKKLFKYLGYKVGIKDISIEFVKMSLMSVAKLSIVPIQDILSLGEESRINKPATIKNNWKWRLKGDETTRSVTKLLAELTKKYGRA
ncbi:MAG: 4-alpha-glucanotransferase [Candidatus Aureabacteria bacterium]|nr:4-alpha-glucanotransferase [Candidatus Auribacterota bacterium]